MSGLRKIGTSASQEFRLIWNSLLAKPKALLHYLTGQNGLPEILRLLILVPDRGYHSRNILWCQMTITWNSPAKTQNHNHLIICTLRKTHLIHLFQVKQNWLTWNTYRPQRALKRGLVFQVNVRNASIHIRLFATGKKWPFLSRCAQEMMFFPLFVLATGPECRFCSRCAQETIVSARSL